MVYNFDLLKRVARKPRMPVTSKNELVYIARDTAVISDYVTIA